MESSSKVIVCLCEVYAYEGVFACVCAHMRARADARRLPYLALVLTLP